MSELAPPRGAIPRRRGCKRDRSAGSHRPPGPRQVSHSRGNSLGKPKPLLGGARERKGERADLASLRFFTVERPLCPRGGELIIDPERGTASCQYWDRAVGADANVRVVVSSAAPEWKQSGLTGAWRIHICTLRVPSPKTDCILPNPRYTISEASLWQVTPGIAPSSYGPVGSKVAQDASKMQAKQLGPMVEGFVGYLAQ